MNQTPVVLNELSYLSRPRNVAQDTVAYPQENVNNNVRIKVKPNYVKNRQKSIGIDENEKKVRLIKGFKIIQKSVKMETLQVEEEP